MALRRAPYSNIGSFTSRSDLVCSSHAVLRVDVKHDEALKTHSQFEIPARIPVEAKVPPALVCQRTEEEKGDWKEFAYVVEALAEQCSTQTLRGTSGPLG